MQEVKFNTNIHAGKLVVRVDKGSKSFGKTKVLKNLDLEIRGKDRLWIYGPNGTGKSTLVKIINTESSKNSTFYTNIGGNGDFLDLTNGKIEVGPNLKVGYFAQNPSFLNYDNLLQNEIYQNTNISEEGLMYTTLARFMFSKEDAKYKRVKDLSPGQRARFVFALFSINDYDVLILDEPTNHLDIASKEVIEQSLRQFKGTLILVSHDRYFVQKVNVNKVLDLQTNTVRHT